MNIYDQLQTVEGRYEGLKLLSIRCECSDTKRSWSFQEEADAVTAIVSTKQVLRNIRDD